MAKIVAWAQVRVPEYPRARFFARNADAGPPLIDVTGRVVRLELEDLETPTGECRVLRLDEAGTLVWSTKHPSLQEARWHVEFEYGLPEDKWQAQS